MYKEIAKLILYRDLGEDSILLKLGGIFEDFELNRAGKAELTKRIYEQMKALLDLSTKYGFDIHLSNSFTTHAIRSSLGRRASGHKILLFSICKNLISVHLF